MLKMIRMSKPDVVIATTRTITTIMTVMAAMMSVHVVMMRMVWLFLWI